MNKEINDKKGNKSSERRKAVFIAVPAAVIVIILLAAFLIIPSVMYSNASASLSAGEFDRAIEGFGRLRGFRDSPERLNEACYEKACSLLDSGEFGPAKELFTSLGDYSDSEEMIPETELRYSEELISEEKFIEALELLDSLEGKGRSAELADSCIGSWVSHILENEDRDSLELLSGIELGGTQQAVLYSLVDEYIKAHPQVSLWYPEDTWKSGAPEITKTVYGLLALLPEDYENAGSLAALMHDMQAFLLSDYRVDYNYFRQNAAMLREIDDYELVRNIFADDLFAMSFLDGSWADGSGWYFSFVQNSYNGILSSSTNLPSVPMPFGTACFNLRSGHYVYENNEGEELAKVFRFEIKDFDTLEVYSYQADLSVTMHRSDAA